MEVACRPYFAAKESFPKGKWSLFFFSQTESFTFDLKWQFAFISCCHDEVCGILNKGLMDIVESFHFKWLLKYILLCFKVYIIVGTPTVWKF